MQIGNVVVETVSPVRKRLQVEVPASEVQSELDRMYASVGREARIRGFRQGRVPRAVLEAHVRRSGAPRGAHEARRALVAPRHRGRAPRRHRLARDRRGRTDARARASSTPATVDIRPIIDVGDTSGIEVTRPILDVDDADVARALDAMRENVAQLKPIEDRFVVEAGDIVALNVASHLEGSEPQKREGALVEAGSGSFPQALENQLVGQTKGSSSTIEVPYPAEYGNSSLAGKTVRFDVEIVGLKLKELPPLDDDFARDHGNAESLDALRTRVRGELEGQASARADAAVQDGLLDQLIARYTFDVPPSLVGPSLRCNALCVRRPPPGGPRGRAAARTVACRRAAARGARRAGRPPAGRDCRGARCHDRRHRGGRRN
jgi:trigger factor